MQEFSHSREVETKIFLSNHAKLMGMKIETIKTDSIAHLSYLIIDGNQAAVIDPRRDCKIYVDKAAKNGAEIKYIFETHRNEDYITGSRELSRYSQAKIYHGQGLDFEFGNFTEDQQEFRLDTMTLKTLSTPGHTPESISIALYPNPDSQQAVAVFTGDTLFVNDVGRTDFFKDRMEEFAEKLYDSIHQKILPLGDQTIVYPAHGAGSVCGGGIADREFSTLGFERQNNPMLQLRREEFIKRKVNEEHQMPPYFKEMEKVNLKGNDRPLLSYEQLEFLEPTRLASDFDKYQVLDTREPEAFLGCHIPGSLSIPTSMLGAYAGYLVNYQKPIVLVTDSLAEARKAKQELLRLGFDNTQFFLKGGLTAWETSGQSLESFDMFDVSNIENLQEKSEVTLLDVRKPGEWEDGIIPQARTLFLGDLPHSLDEFKKDESVVTYCGSGKRATIAASVLGRSDVKSVAVFMGSYAAYRQHKDSQ